MNTPEIRPFDTRTASDDDYAALSRHFTRMRAVTFPDDPPVSPEPLRAELRHFPEFVRLRAWVAWDGGEIVAGGVVTYQQTEDNAHLVEFDIGVAPDHRRRGLGRALLGLLAAVPRETERRLMLTRTNGRDPAGAAFLGRLGAARGMETHTNQLRLDGLDDALLARWRAAAPAFTLEFCDGPYPEERLEAWAELMTEQFNAMPRDGLDLEDQRLTPAHLRQYEAMLLAGGTVRWTLVAADAATGRPAGFTEVFWNPASPEVVQQASTGVAAAFRGRGLARRLKAEMLTRLRRDRPQARLARTGNADTNAAMLAINTALGFRPYSSVCVWQVPTERVLAYLAVT